MWNSLWIAGCALAVLNAALVGLVVRLRWRLRRQVQGREEAEQIEQATRRELFRLRHELDVLAAIREVSLVANEGVDLQRILAEVLRITEELVGSHGVAIHRWDEEEGTLRLMARRQEGEIELFAQPPLSVDGLAAEAFQQRRTLRRFEGDRFSSALLMFCDRRVIGVIRADLRTRGRSGAWLRERERQLEGLAKHITLAVCKPALYDRAVLDGLTGLYTRRHFGAQLRKHFGASQRLGSPLSLIMVDLDHFKQVNDTHGHLTGDRVLEGVAQVMRQSIREYDTAFRYGGEELAVLAPECRPEDALTLAERLRQQIAEACFVDLEGAEVKVTASVGVATWYVGMRTPQQLIAEADRALYASKESGRNRVTSGRFERAA